MPTAAGYLVAVADGAGGTGNGGVAAQRLVKGLADLADTAASEDWFTVLLKLDEEILERRRGGQTRALLPSWAAAAWWVRAWATPLPGSYHP
ncbi:MAG TPA: hypothetical protein VE266_09815, partial [Steroidobacteraceae bacterium]|nr:hypothetical protein [Steroidobacteraceae bacterium]